MTDGRRTDGQSAVEMVIESRWKNKRGQADEQTDRWTVGGIVRAAGGRNDEGQLVDVEKNRSG